MSGIALYQQDVNVEILRCRWKTRLIHSLDANGLLDFRMACRAMLVQMHISWNQ